MECIYILLTFGIASELLPIKAGKHKINVSDFKMWIRTRSQLEKKKARDAIDKGSNQSISLAGQYDVLFGRGKLCQNNPGNIRLRKLIDASRGKYETAKILEKTLIAEQIVQSVKDLSSRFLKQDCKGGGWIEVDEAAARDKISHIFRDKRRKITQQEQLGPKDLEKG
jgi:hypothetical protein